MDIGSEADLLPLLFDQVVEKYPGSKAGAVLRSSIVTQLLRAIEEAAARETHAARIKTVDPIEPTDYTPLSTYDRLSGTHLSRSNLVSRIATHLGLSERLVEIAVLMVEAHLDLALATQDKIVVRDISFQYVGPRKDEDSDSKKDSRVTIDHTTWSRELHAHVLKGITTDRFFRIGRSKRSADIDMLSQGLLAGAAFRIAAPMKIEVSNRVIDSIIEGFDEFKPDVRILHISDLHFGDNLYDKGSRKVKSGFMKTHSIEAAIELGEAVQKMDRKYDVLVATGDLTTHGRKQELLNAQQFITGATVRGLNPSRLEAHALKASRGRRILIPGNHDRYGPYSTLPRGQQPEGNTQFEDFLELPRTYPYVVGFRNDSEDDKALTVLFFVFDSSMAREIDNPLNRLAMGNVSKPEMSKALELSEAIVRRRQVDDLYGRPMKFTPENSVRIALLHHHPLLREKLSFEYELGVKSNAQPSAMGWQRLIAPFRRNYKDLEERAMALKEGPEFIENCMRCGIQVVLFGHRHETWGGSKEAAPAEWLKALDRLKEISPTDLYCSALRLQARVDKKTLKLYGHGLIEEDDKKVLDYTLNEMRVLSEIKVKFEEGVSTTMTPFGQAPERLHFFCCPSTLEHGAHCKGFYVLDIVDSQKLSVSFYKSTIRSGRKPSPFEKIGEVPISLLDSAQKIDSLDRVQITELNRD